MVLILMSTSVITILYPSHLWVRTTATGSILGLWLSTRWNVSIDALSPIIGLSGCVSAVVKDSATETLVRTHPTSETYGTFRDIIDGRHCLFRYRSFL